MSSFFAAALFLGFFGTGKLFFDTHLFYLWPALLAFGVPLLLRFTAIKLATLIGYIAMSLIGLVALIGSIAVLSPSVAHWISGS